MLTTILAFKFAKTTKVNKMLFLFSLFWFLGLLFGICCVDSIFNIDTPYITITTKQNIVSYFKQWFMMFLPWLLSLLLYRIPTKLPFMLFIAAKAYSYSFCVYAVLFSFSGAGWLVRYLFLFAATLSVLAFLRFWICCICETATSKTIVQTILLISLAVNIDFWIVYPYLNSLF